MPDAAAAAPEPAPRTERWVVTLLAPVPHGHAQRACAALARGHGFAFDMVTPLAAASPWALDVHLLGSARPDADGLRAALREMARALACDAVLQREGPQRRGKRLALLDVDSTLIRQEVIDELARRHGVFDRVAAITERAMNGHIDFDTALRERVALLAGAPAAILADVAAAIELTPGAERLVRVLQRLGCRIALVSGGFLEIVRPLQARFGIDHAFANQLELQDGHLTGRVTGPIVNRQRKAELLVATAAHERVDLPLTLAIGDGANDLDMLARAGLGVAFRAKPVVQAQALAAINQPGLDAVLLLLGLSEADVAGW
ncbi:MAG: phosphoserine phosphatase SerB [Myxococcales bacterium]|nr:phosphoserine phosphatase SerB [Myxococcales bacterium]